MLTIILIVATIMAIGLFYFMVAGSGDKAARGKRTLPTRGTDQDRAPEHNN